MAAGTFANIVNSYGLKSNGYNAIDVVNGIPVRINNYQGNATVFVHVGKEKAQSIIGAIKEAAVAQELKKPAVNGEAITFTFKKAMLAVEHYGRIRKIISDHAGLLNTDQCPYCSMGNCDVAGMYKGLSARKMHRQCYLNSRNTEMDKIKNSDGNYITGIIGAIIAAILIVALADLLVIGLNRIFYILYLGFPLFIAGGFRMGKGPYGPAGSFCHVTVSVLAMYVYFYIQGCYYASQWFRISMIDAVPYFGDIMEIITDSEFLKNSALEIILFVVGIIIALVANPTSKLQGTKSVQQNDVFITPLSTATGYSGTEAYNPYSGQDTQSAMYGNNDPYNQPKQNFASAFGSNSQEPADAYGNQTSQSFANSFGDQSASQNNSSVSSGWNDVYGNSDSGNNNGFGN